jgi:hypothetical protein
MSTRDRRRRLLDPSATLNGIDFVAIDAAQTTLVVHFLNTVPLSGTLTATPTITGGDAIPSVAVAAVQPSDWGMDGTHVTLVLHVAAPGDFSTYALTLASPWLDAFFATAPFSFKALCPSDADCEIPPPPCPRPQGTRPPISYLAKDFLSFRQALLDFSALRYPNWQERAEADFGVMLLETLASVADDLSYTQDRVAAEATLTTATQRRSVVRHARLVDYEPAPAVSAQTILQFTVALGTTAIPYGAVAVARANDGTPIPFETGPNLAARPGGVPASADWNIDRRKIPPRGLIPYWFDDSTQCLRAGTTNMLIEGHGHGFQPGQMLLIETYAGIGQAPVRQIVHLLDDSAGPSAWTSEIWDEVFTIDASPPAAGQPTPVTQINWAAPDALQMDRDLQATTVSGNLVVATQGVTVQTETFTVNPASGDPATPAVVRRGTRQTNTDGSPGEAAPQYLHTLAAGMVAWLPAPPGAGDPSPIPEIQLTQLPSPPGLAWSWVRRLLEAQPFDLAFTLDAAVFRPIQRWPDGSVQFEYDGDDGDTIRFGDGNFGLLPADRTPFCASYRVGVGGAGNVAAEAISQIQSVSPSGLQTVSNPLPATGGTDAETLDHVRRIAPAAFRLPLRRAVIALDYETIAVAPPITWAEQARTTFRWTGSWLTVFSTPDPKNGQAISPSQRTAVTDALNRSRMAGYESYVPDPAYVSVDILVQLCAQPAFFAANIRAAVLLALTAFFDPADFSFGQALERSVVEAAVQNVPGVAGILCLQARVRTRSPAFGEMPEQIVVGSNQIIRCVNDPSKPERGLISVQVMGGR